MCTAHARLILCSFLLWVVTLVLAASFPAHLKQVLYVLLPSPRRVPFFFFFAVALLPVPVSTRFSFKSRPLPSSLLQLSAFV